MPPTPRCHPDGVRRPRGTGHSCTRVSPHRSRGRCPGAPVRTMRFSRAGGCVRSQRRRVKSPEVPQRARRCRPPALELPGGSPHPALPTGTPRPRLPPGPGWPQASPSPGAWCDAVLAPAGESQEGGRGTGPARATPRQRPTAATGNGRVPAGSPSAGSSETRGQGPRPSRGPPSRPRCVLQEALSAQTARRGAVPVVGRSPTSGKSRGSGRPQAVPWGLPAPSQP